jgi:hypothetical protein
LNDQVIEMTDSLLKEMLTMLSEAPDGQIDKTICERIKELIDQDRTKIKSGLESIINDCVCYSLASDFAMKAIYYVYGSI